MINKLEIRINVKNNDKSWWTCGEIINLDFFYIQRIFKVFALGRPIYVRKIEK